MPLLQDLYARRKAAWNGANAMHQEAVAEHRDFTAEEQYRWNALTKQMESLDERIAEVTEARKEQRSRDAQRPNWIHNGDAMENRQRPLVEGLGEIPLLPTLREYRALSEGTAGAGGYLVPPEQSRLWMDYLRKKAAFLAAGPRVVQMETDEQHIPKIASSVTVGQYAENAAITPSDPGFAEVVLQPKATAALTLISRQVWDDSTPTSVRELVAYDFAAEVARHLDSQFFTGDGTGQNLTGLRNVAGVNVVAHAAALTSLDTVLLMVDRLRQSNAGARPAFFGHARTLGTLQRLKDTTNQYILAPPTQMGQPPQIAGIPFHVANVLPTNLGAGTNG